MALSYKARRRLALLILVIGLPIYIIAAVTVVNAFQPTPPDRMPIIVELLVYVGLGIIWAIPLRFVFRGVGQPDPDGPQNDSGKDL